MDQREGQDGGLFAQVAEAASDITFPITPQKVLEAITRAIENYSAATEMPEVVELVSRNRIPQLLGSLPLDESLKADTLGIWEKEVDYETARAGKLPRKTKKAVQKKLKGTQLGQRELARLQALRQREMRDEH